MEKSAILKADLLDIVFEGRNKEYGAYELRRTYNRRLRLSVTVMLLLVAMLCVGHLLASRITDNESRVALVPTDHNLTDVKLPDEEPLPPPPAVKPPPPEQVRSIQVTPPKIVPDEEAPQTEVPLNEDLENVKIDVVNRDGVDETGIVDPPKADEGKGILDVPKTPEKKEEIFTSVQIESQYVGGKKAWERFLIRNLHVPQLAIDNLIEGTVVVQFVVDKEGNVSRVEAISGPVELREEAVRVIKKSGKWTPAIQNGMQVPSYKKQPIGFRISSD